MNTEETLGAQNQDNRTLLIVAALVGSLFCCCGIGIILYFVLLFSAITPRLLTPKAFQTPTPISLQEINSATPLGKFYFGLDGINDSCVVIRRGDKFSQEDLLRSEYIYFSAHFDDKNEGQALYWSIYDTKGKTLYEDEEQELSSDLNNCLEKIILIDPRAEPGDYILEVKYEGKIAYREVFHIEYSDLSKIPRPDRKPFGEISLGRSIDITLCIAENQSSTYDLLTLKENPWFYIVAPFQLNDIGKKVYWSVFDSDGNAIFDKKERTIYDDIELCFWQGFSMEGSPAGKYTVVVENDQSVTVFKTEFELR